MGDYESRMFDIQLEIRGLIDRINKRDPALCNCNWRDLTYDYDLDYINYIFQNINDEEMLDIVKDLICKEHRRLLMEGEILLHIDEVSGYPDDKFESSLDFYADNRKEVLIARRDEQEARERYAKKLGKGEAKRNSAEDSTTGEGSITEESASKMDWVKLTDRFDLEKIKEVVKNTGKSNEEKRIVVKAIYKALMSEDKLYNIPYSVDKLILQLYQEYGGQLHTGKVKKEPRTVTPQIPECLTTPEAEQIWDRLRKAGFIVKDGYGLEEGISNNQAAYIASCMADKLSIDHKWKVFQNLWGIKNMAQLAGAWKETGKLPPRANEIRNLV